MTSNMSTQKPRILTGLQPSGTLHIGNYFAALAPQVVLSKTDAEVFLMVADYHALTSVRDGAVLRGHIYDLVRDYLAAGIDAERVTLFRQSDNQDHHELAWIFECLVSVKFLELAHAYKDKVAKGLDANAGLFNYPMLMAADIVLYDVDLVPVGEDQRQHLEYAREAVSKFNLAYGPHLKEPKEIIEKSVGIVPGTDGKKMSKSYKNTIPVFGARAEIEKAVLSIVTDSSGDRPEHVYAIHKVLYEQTGRSLTDLDTLYDTHKGKYKALKDALTADLDAFIAPMREKRESISDDVIKDILAAGAEKARTVSSQTLARVRRAIGITL
jgi:tryptophanyl-tRNA synthetase